MEGILMPINNQNTALSFSSISIPPGYGLDQAKICHDVDVKLAQTQTKRE